MGFLSGFSKVGFVENYGLNHNHYLIQNDKAFGWKVNIIILQGFTLQLKLSKFNTSSNGKCIKEGKYSN